MGEANGLESGVKHESEPDLAEQWRAEILDSPNFSPNPVELQWENGIEYRYNPFERKPKQVFAVGTQYPSAVVYNFAKSLNFAQQEAIRGTYQWFYDNAGLETLADVPHVVIGNHLQPIVDDATGATWRRLGMYDGENPQPVISLDAGIFSGKDIPEAKRYAELLDRGIPLSEIILTHELIHGSIPPESEAEQHFADYVGWQKCGYYLDGWFYIQGLRHVATGRPSSAMTDHSYLEPANDAAEAGTFYRFLPDSLTTSRFVFMDRHFHLRKKDDLSDRLPGSRVQMVRLAELVYPQWNQPG